MLGGRNESGALVRIKSGSPLFFLTRDKGDLVAQWQSTEISRAETVDNDQIISTIVMSANH